MKFKCYITTCYNPRLLVGEFDTKAEADSYIRGSASGWVELASPTHNETGCES